MGSVVGAVREARQAAVQAAMACAAGVEREGFVVGEVVGFAHEGVDGAHGVGLVLREDAEGVVEVFGFALGDGAAVRRRPRRVRVIRGCEALMRVVPCRCSGGLERCAELAGEGAAEEAELGGLGDDGAGLEGVIVLRGDGVEDGVAAVDEELQGGGEVAVDEGGDALAAGEARARVGDEKLHHGADVGVEVAGDELFVGDVEALHGVGGDVAAAAGAVFDDVLIEVGELEAGADFVGELHELFGVIAADEENEAADGVGGVARVVLEGGEGFVVGVDLVLLEGGDEVVKGLDGEIALRDGGLQRYEDGMARGGGIGEALVEHGAPVARRRVAVAVSATSSPRSSEVRQKA